MSGHFLQHFQTASFTWSSTDIGETLVARTGRNYKQESVQDPGTARLGQGLQGCEPGLQLTLSSLNQRIIVLAACCLSATDLQSIDAHLQFLCIQPVTCALEPLTA